MRIVSRLFSFLVFVDAFRRHRHSFPFDERSGVFFPCFLWFWCSPRLHPSLCVQPKSSVPPKSQVVPSLLRDCLYQCLSGIVVEHNVDLRSQSRHSVPVGCIAEAMHHSWRIRKLKTGYRPVSQFQKGTAKGFPP